MSRGPFVRLRPVAIGCLGLVWGGCSYLFVTGPPPRHARSGSFDCTTSNAAPVFDAIWGTLNTAGNISLASKGGPNMGFYAAGAVGSAILWGSSAIVGFSKTSRCREARKRVRECPGGMQQVDSLHCCWPGQRFIAEEAQCSGVPTCPPGMVASEASCQAPVARCPSGMQQVDSLHCCWPGQRFIVERAECSGVPTCPPGMVASGASCQAPPPDHR